MGGNEYHAKGNAVLRELLRALRYRNFRLFFIGQGISLIGTWMQQVAMSWLVYRLTGSALLLGAIGFCAQIPTFLLASFAGVFADRVSRRSLLLCTQTLSMIQAFVLAALVLTGAVQVWHIILTSLFIGTVNAFDMPTRQSFFIEMIEKKEDLANAIALNSSLFNGARLIGPALAGAVIAMVGEGICFFINGVSFFTVIAALYMMRLGARQTHVGAKPLWHELREGFAYAYAFTPIRYILMMLAMISLTGMQYTIILPVFAGKVLHGGAHTFGFLMSASGVGAFAAAVYMASRRSVLGLGRVIAIASAVFGVALILFSFSRNFWLSMFMLLFAGFASITQVASCNTILQTVADDDKRGRVMSFYTMAFMGTAPIGSLLAGALAGRIGAPATLAMGGSLCLLSSLAFYMKLPAIRRVARPVYMRMGIIPEVARGIQTASEASVSGENKETGPGE
jgi:MFS family permease